MAKKREIRVFISSTFLDMQKERDHLNQVVFPRLRKLCANRGVSFYAIDLRWGVTEEETRLNRTIDICLNQVAQCIPYFIGLLGNRYGWIPDQPELVEKYPWLGDYGTISATEMEIRYYLRQAKADADRSFFAIKGQSLCLPEHDDDHQLQLQQLAESIREETGRAPFVYASIEDLGRAISENIQTILDREYPAEECTLEHRLELYRHRMEHYDDSQEMRRMEQENWDSGGNPFLYARRDPMAFDVMEQALLRFRHMVLLETPGMMQLHNRYIHHAASFDLTYSHPKLHSCCLMLDADDRLRNPIAILEECCRWLQKHTQDPSRYRLPDTTRISGTDLLGKLMSTVSSILYDLPESTELMLCITNLHLLNQASPWYYLPFLTCLVHSRLRLVLTTADPEQARLLQKTGIPVRNFPLRLENAEKAGFFAALVRSLELEGKHLEGDLLVRLRESPCLNNMQSAMFLADYLKNYVIFDNLIPTVLQLLELGQHSDIYTAAWQLRQAQLLADSRFSQDEHRQILAIAAGIFQVLQHLRLPEAVLDSIFTTHGQVSRLLYLEAFHLIAPFLTHDGSGLCIYCYPCRQALAPLLPPAVPGLGSGLVQAFLTDLNPTWYRLEDSYALLRYLTATEDTDQIIRLVTGNQWLSFVCKTDMCLLRMAWQALASKDLLDVKKIYSGSNHIRSSGGLSAPREVYDMLMRMEICLAGTDSIECFLDIPFHYSTDIEKELKTNWGPGGYPAVRELRANADSTDVQQLRQYPMKHAQEHGFDPSLCAFMWEIICKSLSKRNALTADDISDYIYYAARAGALRLLADGLRYAGILEEPFRLLH